MESTTTAHNLYLQGNFAPVEEEVTALDLAVEGEIPIELEGRYLRNGPNPWLDQVDALTYHWFLGEGMVHGVRLRGGRAEWYRNRRVRSADVSARLGEAPVPAPPGRLAFSANTSVGGFAGRTWAMVEAGSPPFELGYELETVACNDFFGTLPRGYTAHPKLDPSTGCMHAMCYDLFTSPAQVDYVVVGRDARVQHVAPIPLPELPMVHDISITEHYAIVYDLPVTFAPGDPSGRTFPFAWDPAHEARVGVLPLGGTAGEIIWCTVGQCYAYHPLNAYEVDSRHIVVDLCRYEKMFDADRNGPALDGLPTLDRWTIDLDRRMVAEERIDERPQEFPRVRSDLTGRRHRYGYAAGVDAGFAPGPTYKHDFVSGISAVHDHGPGRGTAEPAFVGRLDGTDEDDGFLLSFVYDATTESSELVVLDAREMSAPPLARVFLPQRVPHGFHGNWVSDRSVPPPSPATAAS